jgi:hypothetical protein
LAAKSDKEKRSRKDGVGGEGFSLLSNDISDTRKFVWGKGNKNFKNFFQKNVAAQ